MAINLVWLKRDLRLADHPPLKAAIEHAQQHALHTVLLYVFEPILLQDPHYCERHWRFVTQSLADINRRLKAFGARISVAHGDAQSVFERVHSEHHLHAVFSHEEIGLANTFERDQSLTEWFTEQHIEWAEYPCGAVIRGITDRANWDKQWRNTMHGDLAQPALKQLNATHIDFDTHALPKLWAESKPDFQIGGSTAAYACLDDFFLERGQDYHWQISKPAASQVSCSRMSPYLAWGNISLRELYQTLLSHWTRPGWRRALVALSRRLHWHCHFMQKFESECGMQFQAVNAAYEQLPYRQDERVNADLLAWKEGKTGFPLIDACMRCLHATGYLNFRMRAMLVSFLCHHLNIDWRLGVEHLASVFLDFEPGIHYPQFQMQAGVTGINTIRIYNPTKQALEHDPDALFIKQWCPELREVPVVQCTEPWRLTPMEQRLYSLELGIDYPEPMCDLSATYKDARQRLWSFKHRADVKQEAQRILHRHVRAS